MGLDPAMEEAPKKFYVAYRISQNITCLEVQKQRCLLFVKVDPASVGPLPTFARDVRAIGSMDNSLRARDARSCAHVDFSARSS